MMFGPVSITQFDTRNGERVEDLDVGFWSVEREEHLRDSDDQDNEVYNYHWAVSVRQRNGATEQYTGRVDHRYGDGWLELLRKVFEAAQAAEMREDKIPAGTGPREVSLEVVSPDET